MSSPSPADLNLESRGGEGERWVVTDTNQLDFRSMDGQRENGRFMLVPACWFIPVRRVGEGEPHFLLSFPHPKTGDGGRKKRRIDNDSDVLRASQLSLLPIPLFLPAHAAAQ